MNASIQPFLDNPFYWQLNEDPVVLIGGSVDDNLYQIDNLEEHLDLVRNCSRNEAYCSAIPGSPYLLFFPDGGSILLNAEGCKGIDFTVQFIDIRKAGWYGEPIPSTAVNGQLSIVTPLEEGYWAAIVKVHA